MDLSFTKQRVLHPVITSLEEFDKLNWMEIRAGYLSDPSEVPWDKSHSFVHGWRNAQIDSGLMPITTESAMLARDVARKTNGKS